MNDWEKAGTSVINNSRNGYADFCGNRLPCGICRLLMTQCPVTTQTIEVTCTTGQTK